MCSKLFLPKFSCGWTFGRYDERSALYFAQIHLEELFMFGTLVDSFRGQTQTRDGTGHRGLGLIASDTQADVLVTSHVDNHRPGHMSVTTDMTDCSKGRYTYDVRTRWAGGGSPKSRQKQMRGRGGSGRFGRHILGLYLTCSLMAKSVHFLHNTIPAGQAYLSFLDGGLGKIRHPGGSGQSR